MVVTFTEATGLGGLTERRVMFEDGTDVDLVPIPIERMDELMSQAGALPVLSRGFRVLVEKDGLFTGLADRVAAADARGLHGASPWPPDADVVLNQISSYLYHCSWIARKLRRGEITVALDCHNGFQADILLRFVEWQARARSNDATWTLYEGRFLEDWAPGETVEALAVTRARYDPDDLMRSVVQSLAMFELLAREVVAAVGAEYPAPAHEWTRNDLRRLFGR